MLSSKHDFVSCYNMFSSLKNTHLFNMRETCVAYIYHIGWVGTQTFVSFWGFSDTVIPLCSHMFPQIEVVANLGSFNMLKNCRLLINLNINLGKFHLIAKCCNPRGKKNAIKCQTYDVSLHLRVSVWDGRSWCLYGINWTSITSSL